MTAEDHVGRGGRELATVVAVARLEDDRVALRAARHVEIAEDAELRPAVGELARRTGAHEGATCDIGHQVVVGPRIPERPCRCDELAGTRVALAVVEEAAAPEVLAGECVGRRDHVPHRPPVRQVIQGGQLTGEFVRLAEGGVERSGQTDVGGHGRERSEHGQRVGTADGVEIVDQTVLLAQAEALGEEEEVEFAALGRLGEMHERRELDLALRPRIGPHRGVVDAREVGGEDHLLRSIVHDASSPKAYRLGRRGNPNRSRSSPLGRPRPEHAPLLQSRDHGIDDEVEVVADHARARGGTRARRRRSTRSVRPPTRRAYRRTPRRRTAGRVRRARRDGPYGRSRLHWSRRGTPRGRP